MKTTRTPKTALMNPSLILLDKNCNVIHTGTRASVIKLIKGRNTDTAMDKKVKSAAKNRLTFFVLLSSKLSKDIFLD